MKEMEVTLSIMMEKLEKMDELLNIKD